MIHKTDPELMTVFVFFDLDTLLCVARTTFSYYSKHLIHMSGDRLHTVLVLWVLLEITSALHATQTVTDVFLFWF